jgi:hypothetical protein
MSNTTKIMLLGLAFAALTNLCFYSWIFFKDWSWLQGFPIGWLTIGQSYMGIFFHELGHTAFAWFYGYPTLPMFDFQHGGGLAVWFSDPQIAILGAVWLSLAYGIYHFREIRFLQILCGAFLILNLATFYNEDLRLTVIDFMGPAAQPLVAGFLLFRALFDLAPRGTFERFLNAFFGFGLILASFIDSYGLLHSSVHRLLYYQQKGSHGFGDFDKIDSRFIWIGFEDIVYALIAMTTLCLIVPFILFFKYGQAQTD